jgi:hypothetical protein
MVIAVALSLSACASPASSSPGPTGDPTDAPGASPSASPTPTRTPTDDIGLLRVSARATDDVSGAALDLTWVVREILPAGSPAAKAVFAEVDQQCSTFSAPADYRDGPVTVVEGTVEQVPGTPAWPADQWLYWMTLDTSVLVSGTGLAQQPNVTKKYGKRVDCEGSTWAVASGTSTLYFWSAASLSLSGPDVEKALAMNQYGWFAGTGGPHAHTSLSDCVVEVPETTAARVKAAGHHWVEFAAAPEFADLDGCGVGVGDDAFP